MCCASFSRLLPCSSCSPSWLVMPLTLPRKPWKALRQCMWHPPTRTTFPLPCTTPTDTITAKQPPDTAFVMITYELWTTDLLFLKLRLQILKTREWFWYRYLLWCFGTVYSHKTTIKYNNKYWVSLILLLPCSFTGYRSSKSLEYGVNYSGHNQLDGTKHTLNCS